MTLLRASAPPPMDPLWRRAGGAIPTGSSLPHPPSLLGISDAVQDRPAYVKPAGIGVNRAV
eukprot:8164754-Pyramimonas_sp.AAC.1